MTGVQESSGSTRLQSSLVLPAARAILLVAAILCFLVIIGGLCAAALFEWGVVRPAPQVQVPPPYAPQAALIDMTVVDVRFAPPQNIRFESKSGTIDRPLTEEDILGRLAADTPNGMAKAPDDFAVVGGRESGLFNRVSGGLGPTQTLVDRINSNLAKLSKPETFSASIKVVARDAYGNSSPPTDVAIDLTYGPGPPTPAPAGPAQPARPQITELQRIAQEIALIVDPNKTPRYFEEYARAMRIPSLCGAGQTDAFVRNYGLALERERTKLTPFNVEALYEGICDGWRRIVAAEETERANVENARRRAIAQNEAARREAAIEAAAAWTARNIALIATGAAVGAFLVVALLLAFLAMENHSKALREAVQSLVNLELARNNPTA